jgi:hypothetical protein
MPVAGVEIGAGAAEAPGAGAAAVELDAWGWQPVDTKTSNTATPNVILIVMSSEEASRTAWRRDFYIKER